MKMRIPRRSPGRVRLLRTCALLMVAGDAVLWAIVMHDPNWNQVSIAGLEAVVAALLVFNAFFVEPI